MQLHFQLLVTRRIGNSDGAVGGGGDWRVKRNRADVGVAELLHLAVRF